MKRRISKKSVCKIFLACSAALGITTQSADVQASYDVTFYVAGMGGHFAQADIHINPKLTAAPFKLKNLDKIDIGTRETHPVHDARIDHRTNTMYWSTYKVDASPELANIQVAHVGQTDLKTGEVLQDSLISIPPEAKKIKSLYCASGQTKDYFIPISMANKGYIDVIRKEDMKLVQRVFLEGTEADIGKPYKFYHGTTTPDEKKIVITINEAETDHGKLVGKMHFFELEIAALLQGKVKVTNRGLATAPGHLVSFRQYFSPDGTLLANSGGGYMLLMDAKTLKPIDIEVMPNLTENHDAIFTPDGKYVVATSRSKAVLEDCSNPQNPDPDEYIMDGQLFLYDVTAQKFVGEPVSVCAPCHQTEGVDEHAVLCGIDAVWNQ